MNLHEGYGTGVELKGSAGICQVGEWVKGIPARRCGMAK
jgi:hypothetical protein